MGGTNTEALTFLNVSCGKFINKKQGLSFNGYEGTLVKITREEDEYKGKSSPKVALRIKDFATGETAKISFSLQSYFSLEFFQRIEKVDLAKPFHLGVYGSKTNDKLSYCWMKQGVKIEPDKDFPEPKDVVVSRETVKDWSEFIDRAEKTIAELAAKLDTPAESPATAAAPRKEDDLPF